MGRYYVLTTKREFYPRINPIVRYTDKKFVQRYRLSKQIVLGLVAVYVATLETPHLRGKHSIPHSLMFCIALRYFATGANYTPIADCHGVSKSSVTRAVKKVSLFFHLHLADYVIWPDPKEEKNFNSMLFLAEKKKPGVFGLVDGTHIPIICPRGATTDENQYFCYKGYYSLNTMIICNWEGCIFHVDALQPGSSNDIYCMNGSRVKFYGERGDFAGYFLLGDSGYVLTDYVLIPVREEQTQADSKYNRWHKSTRSKVERVIGVLKQRWRCLDSSGGYLMHDPDRAGHIVETCVCLHNVAKKAKVKLYKEEKSTDGYRRVGPRVVQPQQPFFPPCQQFANIRKDYIDIWFSGA